MIRKMNMGRKGFREGDDFLQYILHWVYIIKHVVQFPNYIINSLNEGEKVSY